MVKVKKPKLLLHSCCAGCTAYVIQLLSKEYQVTSYFFNPNIHPDQEYKQRCQELKNYCKKTKAPFIEGEYQAEKWQQLTKGFEFEPEKGKRCLICYAMRLEKTAEHAKQNGFDFFATTLSVSPHKLADRINQFGNKLAELYGVKFYEADFKKQEGYKKACAISKEENFYRQDYCGCSFSKRGT
ncbi:MAG: epoxyqueuosine reductase QueH [Patescibacteria group bacterium]